LIYKPFALLLQLFFSRLYCCMQ